MENITQSLQQGLSTFFGFIPQLVGAVVILVVGYIVAKVLQGITTRVLQGMGFQGWMERGGIKQFFDRSQSRRRSRSSIENPHFMSTLKPLPPPPFVRGRASG